MKSEKIYYIILAVLSDEASDEDVKIFRKWYHASDTNKEEFEELKRLYTISFQSKNRSKVFDVERGWSKISPYTAKKKGIQVRHLIWPIAVSLIIFISFGKYFYNWTNDTNDKIQNITEIKRPILIRGTGDTIILTDVGIKAQNSDLIIENTSSKTLTYKRKNISSKKNIEKIKNNINHLIIPIGETYELFFTDGTYVKLNAKSELFYPDYFTENTREVTLIGEAYFDVVKDTSKPFIVKANGLDIKVLGTEFNISCYTKDQTITTTLVNGRVSIDLPDNTQRDIYPSQQLVFDRSQKKSIVKTVKTDLYTCWTENKMIFKNERIDILMSKLQNWYDFEVEYSNDKIKESRFSLEIDKNTELEKIIDIINFTSDIKLTYSNHKILIK